MERPMDLFSKCLRRFLSHGVMAFSAVIVLTLFSVSCQKPKPEFQCHDTLGCVTISPENPIKIGVLQALSGKVASLGMEQIRGIQLALDARQGSILGHPVELKIEDTHCSPEGGANAALKIIADPQYLAILGTTCSTAATGASQVMSDAGLTMISGNNSAPFLTSIAGKEAPHWQKGYFRTAPNEEHSGKAAAIFAFKTLGIRKAATINDGDIYTKGLTDGFSASFQQLGGTIVLDTSVNKGEKEMEPVLTAILNAGAELIFFPLFQPEGNEILFQARTMPAAESLILMSDGALIDASFIESVGESGIGMYFVGPKISTTDETQQRLSKIYHRRFGTPPATTYYLNAYDSAELLFSAIEATAVTEADGTLHIGRQALRETLYGSTNPNGVSGPLDCDSFGDCGFPMFNVLRLDNPDAGLLGLQSNVMYVYKPELNPK